MEADGVGGEARRFGTTSDSAFLFCFYESDSTFRTFLSPLRSPQSPGAKKRDRWQQLVRRKRLFKKKKNDPVFDTRVVQSWGPPVAFGLPINPGGEVGEPVTAQGELVE